MVAIIDYGAGNLSSVKKALDFLGAESEITQDKEKILSASHVILPGVGSFGDAMASMKERGLTQTVKQAAREKNFLGICLGLQLLFESSDESPGVEGLGILKGKIVSIPKDNGLKVPHIGWNSVSLKQKDGVFRGIEDNSYFYFVHSFYLKGADESVVAGVTDYGLKLNVRFRKITFAQCSFILKKAVMQGLPF
jgi:glutamine amidotransferase